MKPPKRAKGYNNGGPIPFKQYKSQDEQTNALISSGAPMLNYVIPGAGSALSTGTGIQQMLMGQMTQVDPETGKFKNKGLATTAGVLDTAEKLTPFGLLKTAIGPGTFQDKVNDYKSMFNFKQNVNGIENENIGLVEAQKAEEEKRKQGLISQSNLTKAFADRAYNEFSDGGTIKGEGTPKSDSISAKIKPGSFVVPAENADKAEMIRKYLLKTPPKKANLSQNKGAKVKVSNKEHLFTKKEKEKITSMLGHEILEELAPNAEDDMELKDGGNVDTKKERESIKSRSQKKPPGSKFEQEGRARKERIDKYNATQRQAEDKQKFDKELKKAKAEYDAAVNSYNLYKEQSSRALNDSRKNAETNRKIGTRGVQENDVASKQIELLDLIDKRKAALDKAQGNFDYSQKESNYLPVQVDNSYRPFQKQPETESSTAVPFRANYTPPAIVGGNSPASKKIAPVIKKQAQPAVTQPSNGLTAEGMRSITPSMDNKMAESQPFSVSGNNMLLNSLGPSITPQSRQSADPMSIAKEVATPTDTSNSGVNSALDAGNFDWMGMANFGLPIMQTYLGNKMLKESGPRPVDQLDPAWQESYNANRAIQDRANREAKFGLSPEERYSLDQRNLGAYNAGRLGARNYSGNSAASAFNLDRQAINDMFNRSVDINAQDRGAKLQKQAYANSLQAPIDALNQQKANYSRLLFDDKMKAWQQNQDAGGTLMNTGISNLIGEKRYADEMKYRKERDAKYGTNFNLI